MKITWRKAGAALLVMASVSVPVALAVQIAQRNVAIDRIEISVVEMDQAIDRLDEALAEVLHVTPDEEAFQVQVRAAVQQILMLRVLICATDDKVRQDACARLP
jgi:hypothetical protein